MGDEVKALAAAASSAAADNSARSASPARNVEPRLSLRPRAASATALVLVGIRVIGPSVSGCSGLGSAGRDLECAGREPGLSYSSRAEHATTAREGRRKLMCTQPDPDDVIDDPSIRVESRGCGCICVAADACSGAQISAPERA